jgi:alpha-L-rhamnosidase
MNSAQDRLGFTGLNAITVVSVTNGSTGIASIRNFGLIRQLAAAAFLCLSCVFPFFCMQASAEGRARPGAPDNRHGDQSQMLVTELKTEHLTEPLGIETSRPRFSWLLDSDERGQLQTGYQVLVATSLDKLQADQGDKWDSGKVSSDNSVEVPYAGRELASGERCYWKVRVWDKNGLPSAYSVPSFFEMGLRKQSEWQGKWIAARKGVSSPIFRRAISIQKPVKRARVYISGLGYYELFINGKKVGDRVLDPASTYYNNDQSFKLNTRVLYAIYDVTPYLQAGANALGVMLGNGWYSAEADVDRSTFGRSPYGDRPRLILQMNLELADGQRLSVVSDANWKTSSGPITYNDLFNGETYDARLEQPGWDKPGFNDSSWESALLGEAPSGVLTAELIGPGRVMQSIQPVKIITSKEPGIFWGTYIYDFGQLFTGWVRIKVRGPRGAELVLKYGSRIYPEDDSLDTRSNIPPRQEARQTDTYILKGEGTEVWEPHFTLHGFRYVEIRGFTDTPAVESIEGRFVRSALEPDGSFASSNELINQIHHNIQWTFMSSFQGIMQDAADRSERVSWLGDPSFVAEDYIYNYDMAAFWEKWLNDIQDSQLEDGNVPIVSPLHIRDGTSTLSALYQLWPCWESTYPLLTWYLYQYYGDTRVLEDHYASLKKLVDFISAHASGYIIPAGMGDHMEPQENGYSHFFPRHTPAGLTSTAYYYYEVWILSQIAEVLHKSEDAGRYAALATNIKEAFNRRFFDSGSNQYATGSQTSNALALYLKLVPPDKVPAVMKNLVDDVVTKHNGHLSTGIIGSNALAQTLPQYGAADVMYRIATQTTYPSLGYQVMLGATAVCESYECGPLLSQNMKMFGSLDKFFYRNLAGINMGSPGYRLILIKPQPVGDLRTVTASQRTVRGTIKVAWVKGDNSLNLNVSIPAGTEADICIPKLGSIYLIVTESGTPVWKGNAYVPGVPGLTGGTDTPEAVILHAGSGSYTFAMNGAGF